MASALVRLYYHCSVTYPGLGRGKVKLSEHYHLIKTRVSTYSTRGSTRNLLSRFHSSLKSDGFLWEKSWRRDVMMPGWRHPSSHHHYPELCDDILTPALCRVDDTVRKEAWCLYAFTWMNEWILHWWLTICVLLFCLLHFRYRIIS